MQQQRDLTLNELRHRGHAVVTFTKEEMKKTDLFPRDMEEQLIQFGNNLIKAYPASVEVHVVEEHTYYNGPVKFACVHHRQEEVTKPTLFGGTVRDFWQVGKGIESHGDSFFDYFAEFYREKDAHDFAYQYAQHEPEE